VLATPPLRVADRLGRVEEATCTHAAGRFSTQAYRCDGTASGGGEER
jgi:hypothetical protein